LQRSTLAKRAWQIFFIAASALYLFGLARLPLLGPDEPRYAQVAREMFERRDWITPTLGGHTWFEKPALLYWMMMAAYSAFGVSEWTARLGSAFSGLLTVLIVYWMGHRVERASADVEASGLASWSSVALATSVGLLTFSRGASTDSILTLTLTATLACFFVSQIEDNARRRRLLLAGFYAGIGLSLLAKGLIGIVIPFGVVGSYFMLRRERPRLDVCLSLLWGVPLFLLVAAVWYVPVIERHGWTFVDQFFIQHHFARYVSNKYHHSQPFYFYPPVLLILVLPWTAFLLAALINARRWSWRGADALSKLNVFALAWLLLPIAFFSLSGSKLPSYILPVVPAAALLTGERLAGFVRGSWNGSWTMRATGVALLVLTVTGIVYARQLSGASVVMAVAVVAPLIVAAASALLWTQRRELCAALVACAMLALIALEVGWGLKMFARRESVRELMQSAAQSGYGDAPVYQMLTSERTAEFYAGGRLAYQADGDPVRFEGGVAAGDAARERGGVILVIIPVEYLNELTDYRAIETNIIGDNGALALVVVKSKPERGR
jgi:4-amino-4-deoxy-L-arabinose transferase-like glycosyltransferase